MESCHAFEVDHIILQEKKDDWIAAFKGLEEEVVVIRQKSLKSLQQVVVSDPGSSVGAGARILSRPLCYCQLVGSFQSNS